MIETNNEGSRSEGRIGVLKYGNTKLEWYFDYVFIPVTSQAYRWYPKINPWDFGGFRTAEPKRFQEKSNPRLGDPDSGWISVQPMSRSIGIPESWIYAERGVKAFWLDPLRQEDLAKAEGFLALGDENLIKPKLVP